MSTWQEDTKALVSKLQDAPPLEELDDPSKLQLLALLENVTAKVQTPIKFLQGLTQDGNKLAIARIAIGMGIFDALAASGPDPVTTQALSSRTKGDESLLRTAPSASSWKATPTSKMLVSGAPPTMVVIYYYTMSKTYASLYEFLESIDFKEPDDYYNSALGYAWKTDKGFWDWLYAGDELRAKAFNTFMGISQSFRGQDWFDFYPIDHIRTDTNRVMLVDVGGGTGQNVLAFKKRFPDVSNQIVLQDLPGVINSVQEPFPSGIEAQSYDVFTPQPVKGAKAYFLRNILHDWPDKQAVQILKNVREAMSPDSVLLTNDNVMDDTNISRMNTDPDFVMMNAFSSKERAESQYRQLIEAAGFKVVQVWKPTKPSILNFALFESHLA